jgi:hypothetical protein
MKSNNQVLGGILQSGNQYVIPVFQRYYRWNRPEWEKLWTDLEALQQPVKTGRHFMGFLVLVPELPMPGKITTFHLIDGQQRLTTLSLLLCALRDAASAAGCEELAEEITQTYLVHPFKKGRERFRVYPRQRDCDQYIAAVDGLEVVEGRIGSALRYFRERLEAIPQAGTDEGLRTFLALLTHRLEFVHATLEGENPYNIFKSLNSTGVPLGAADLIRNFMFMHVPVESQDEFDGRLWRPLEQQFEDANGWLDGGTLSAFLRDFLMQAGQYVSPEGTVDTFQDGYSATDFDPIAVTEQLVRAAAWYRVIIGRRADVDPKVEAALSLLRQLESSTTHPLLLNLYARRGREELTAEQMEKAIRLLAGFILRRLVCGESSRAYGRTFVQACTVLGAAADEDLRAFLEARGHPDTPRFKDAFVRFGLYRSRYARAVLEALERATNHKEQAGLTNAQIEHIMPQTLSADWYAALGPDAEQIHANWLHTPGNLTLSGYNAELQNKPFAVKRQGYRSSNIVITRQLARHTEWGEAEIRARGQALAEMAVTIWPGPDHPPAPVTNGNGKGTVVSGSIPGLQLEYWTAYSEYVAEHRSTLRHSRPVGTNYLNVSLGRTGFALIVYANMRDRRIGVSLYLNGPMAKAQFRLLEDQRAAIEAEIGAPLVWVDDPKQVKTEIILTNSVDPTDRDQWPAHHQWTLAKLEAFDRTFRPRIAMIATDERQFEAALR